MSQCTRPVSKAPTLSPSDFNLIVASEMTQINSMLNEGRQVLDDLERGQQTPQRKTSRTPTRTPPRRDLMSPRADCAFSPKPRASTLIETMAGQAANLIVDALIPELLASTPQKPLRRHPAQQADNLMAFEDASPVCKPAPHSAARRFMSKPQAKRVPLLPRQDSYSGTPSPTPGKWVSLGVGSKKLFVPDSGINPRPSNRRLCYKSSQDLMQMSPSFTTKRNVTFRPSNSSIHSMNQTLPKTKPRSCEQRASLSQSFSSQSPRRTPEKATTAPLTGAEQLMMSACSNFIAQVQSIEESDVMSDSFNEMERQFAEEDGAIYDHMRAVARQRGYDKLKPVPAARFAQNFSCDGADLQNESFELVDDDNVSMGSLICLD